MSANDEQPPAGPPPSYSQATGSSTASSRPNATSSTQHLQVPQRTGGSSSGIPDDRRRSMEDEVRPLPDGWVRQFDAREGHQFFVDTRANPPRSIWHHPYDDDTYLASLSSEERERLQESDRLPSHKMYDAGGESTDEDGSGSSPKYSQQRPSSSSTAELPPRPRPGDRKPSKTSFGSKLKDKLTGTTKEERQRERAQRAEQERQYYEAHQKFRSAMEAAMRTGQPVFFAKDKDGRDVYVEPPGGAYNQRPYGGGTAVNPYAQGPYADPNARFVRPQAPYNRPYGYGYGGYGGGYGYGPYGRGGMGMGMPMMGGLMGGMLLGGLLF